MNRNKVRKKGRVLRIAVGLTILVLLLAGAASAVEDGGVGGRR